VEKRVKEKIKLFKELKPSDLDIPNYLTLDEKTLEYF
jgi:hypothetical protein